MAQMQFWSFEMSGGTTTTTTWTSSDPVTPQKRYSQGWKDKDNANKVPRKVVRCQGQSFDKIREMCVKQEALFEDPDFPADNSSLFYTQTPSHFEWKRPHELVDSPRMFIGGASRFDIVQGELGNCWFLAAISSLCSTKNTDLFDRVVPQDNSFVKDYGGVFHFGLWQYGRWVDVVIDDRLPCINGRLCYVHSKDQNEFWSALLEKAYAKLNGSYEALQGGSSSEAMEDFTGGLCEVYDLRKDVPKNLFTVAKKAFERNSLMGCTIDAMPGQIESVMANGLVMGHAYAITDLKTVSCGGVKANLLRIRNPWGNEYEWKGAWSDKSAEWGRITESEKKQLGLHMDDDGEFWMSFEDFMTNYQRLEICNLSPELLEGTHSKAKWEVGVEEGAWKKRVNAGGCRNFLDTFWTNPQYRVTVIDPDEDDDENTGTLLVALMQTETRKKKSKTGEDLVTLGYMIYQVPNKDHGPLDMNFFKYNKCVGKCAFTNMREVFGRHKLSPGNYVVIPCTFQPGTEGSFILRLFSEKPAETGELDEETGFVDTPAPDKDIAKNVPGGESENRRRRVRAITQDDVDQEQSVRKLFKEVSGEDLEVDAFELRDILNKTFLGEFRFDGFSLETCRSMVAMLDLDHSGKLGYNEFKKMWDDLRKWKNVFREFDQDKSGTFNSFELREALYSGGFRTSNSTFSCLVMRFSDREGKIFFDDFILCAVRMKTMCDIFREMSAGGKTANFSMDENVFREFDQDKSGTFNSFELREALYSGGFRTSNSTFSCLVMRFSDREGKIFFDDFILCAVRMKTMCDIFREMSAGGKTANFSMDEFIQTTMYA